MLFRRKKKKTVPVCHDSVLVVEDNEDVINLLEYLLAGRGYCMQFARDGHQAREIVHSMPPPSLILLDLMIPIHSGFDILKQIRAREGWQNVPVIVLSSREDSDDINKARKLGANVYCPKPFEPDILLQQIECLIKG